MEKYAAPAIDWVAEGLDGHDLVKRPAQCVPRTSLNMAAQLDVSWTGWAWRGDRSEKLFRIGFEYLYGSDPQYEFPFANQNRAGIGMWYDF